MRYLILLFLLSGCATDPFSNQPIANERAELKVDSLTVGSEKRKYVLLSGIKDVDGSDLQYKEYELYVHRSLQADGFIRTDDFNNAEIAIFMTYGIGDPITRMESYNLPVWGQTGVSSAYTHGSVSSFGNTASYSQNTTFTPSYGITGSTTHIRTKVAYIRFLVLDALDVSEYKKSKKKTELWKTTIFSEGPSGDLRKVFPFLASGSIGYLNKSTGQQVEVEVTDVDPNYLTVKGIALPQPNK